MKPILRALGCAAAACLAVLALGTPARSSGAQGASPRAAVTVSLGRPVRLHVVAAGDHPAQQAAKLRAARAVLFRLEQLYASRTAAPVVGSDGFVRLVEAHRRALERAASAAAGAPARLVAGTFFFPIAVDPTGEIYPAGWYPAIRVVLGQGRGRNWWCVVFPPLCPAPAPRDDASARAAPSSTGQAAPGQAASASPEEAGRGIAPPAVAGRPAAVPSGDRPQTAPAPPRPWWVRLLPWNWF